MRRLIVCITVALSIAGLSACAHSDTRPRTVVVQSRNIVVDRIQRGNCWTVEYINNVTKQRGRSACLRGGKQEMLSYHNGDSFP